jgi:hypothetical protein
LIVGNTYGQQSWQPTRLPPHSSAKPLNAPSHLGLPVQPQGSNQAAIAATKTDTEKSGVALRWYAVRPTTVDSERPASGQAASLQADNNLRSAAASRSVQPNGAKSSIVKSNQQANQQVISAGDWNDNPLRAQRLVRTANYQAQQEPQAAEPLPQFPPLPSRDSQEPTQPELMPEQINQEQLSQEPPADPLSDSEPAPAPAIENSRQSPDRGNDRSPFDRRNGLGDQPEEVVGEEADKTEKDDLKIPKQNRNANSASCNEMREKIRRTKLSDISLNTSPDFGGGLRSDTDSKKQRLDFAASAPVRDWMNNTGAIVASGRLIDLRDDRVVLDVNGREQLIPINSLSDIDIDYVGRAWNLPMKCGVGYEDYAGRQFTPSAVEWKASGLCNKPLYFEEVQLERYGHEVGPVMQPLISSAHFFGNALILPYKMGIHPPTECQYALGYYRPGSCAPYMIPAIPWSLRGAAVQAGVVTGGAALIP